MYARYIPPKKTAPVAAPAVTPAATPAASFARALHSNARHAPPAVVQPPPPPPPQKRKIVFDDDDDVVASPFQAAVISSAQDTTAERSAKRLKKEAREEVEQTTADDEDKTAKKRKRRNKKAGKEKDGEEETTEDLPKAADEDTVMASPAPAEKEKKRKRKRKSKGANAEDETSEPAEAEEQKKLEEAGPKDEVKEKKKKKKQEAAAAEDNEESAVTAKEEAELPDEKEMPVRFKALLEKKEKSLKRAKKRAAEGSEEAVTAAAAEGEAEVSSQPQELHGLEPLPQPEPVAAGTTRPTYDTQPRWLAEPVRVSADTRASFGQLGIDDEQVQRVLAERGWTDAFAVQTAVIPMLLPPSAGQQRRGDLVISAATGSGKTLAYVLPLVRDLSGGGSSLSGRRLRAIIVVPTRELVQQVHDVCETCARAFSAGSAGGRRVRIGAAMGNQSLRREQAALVEEEQVYDPAGYRAALRRRQRWPLVGATDGGSTTDWTDWVSESTSSVLLPDHVIRYKSSVDVLVTTPGRLVEHLRSTAGFALDHVRWLVVDEADKLLGQSYQQWLTQVLGRLERPGKAPLGARDFSDSAESGVRKVVLSATMTRDLSSLGSLRLSRPRHVVLKGTRPDGEDGIHNSSGAAEYVLPRRLRESAVKVRDESQKPLYLVDLLNDSGLMEVINEGVEGGDESSEDDSDSSDSDDSSHSSRSKPTKTFATTALIFTRSNENALRLARLLALLLPPQLAKLVGTITSTTRTSERRRTLRAFAARQLRILVATDLAARGIDLAQLDHVINYDMPPSVEFYVHRVGRTARAGRPGHAWTLFTKKEAGWFWPEVAGQGGKAGRTVLSVVRRSGKVAKVVVGEEDEEDEDSESETETETETVSAGRFSKARMAAYEAALEQLGKEAAAERNGGGTKKT
ncbi:dead deah box DNA helicase [Grosmannia clavigera kw1407]|uniref:ATP-dependent RNA helicase n=1 Tax=Grosmannia clavigera (strain kw1407 / UAMH 11150) TaxID=655863 RepID=F0X7D7_GROCL|nr:dead deah box DNA helicase [Grosmannia clavigera kw1407]EFX06576.1 dead deah box DNA helicase [Grosmannia clavigera kw1407]